jgi:chemotaxis protein CheX
VDIQIAKPFIRAVNDVLGTMAMITPTAGTPYVKKDHVAKGDVSGIIGLTGAANGTLSVTFTKTCAVAVVKNMLGGDIQDLLSDVKDGVGELTNMISGQARKWLAESGTVLQSSTPTVVMGANHSISHLAKSPIMAVPFTTEYGDFTIEISLE